MNYEQAFLQKAGEITSDQKPNCPALILFFGDIAARSRAVMHAKLLSQIPSRYHGAITEGGLCAEREARGFSCLPVEPHLDQARFGEFATAWNTPAHAEELDAYLTDLLHRATQHEVAEAMGSLDVYLVVGNDGGACELWPLVMSRLKKLPARAMAITWHLLWLYRETPAYQQPRDSAMCRMIRALVDGNTAAPEVAAIPEAMQVDAKQMTILLFSDRNQSNICSDSVWKYSCEAMAGCMLLRLFGNRGLPPIATCSMFDAIYPDPFWSAGFQISLLKKLRQRLQVIQNNPLGPFKPLLAEAWDIHESDLFTEEGICKLVRRALPEAADLYLMPVDPDVAAKQIKKASSVRECISLLYGTRFDAFFDDALKGASLRERTTKLCAQLVDAIDAFARSHGAPAAAALLDPEQGLPASFRKVYEKLEASPSYGAADLPKPSIFVDAVERRHKDVMNTVGKQRMQLLYRDAARALIEQVKETLASIRPACVANSDALYDAFDRTYRFLRSRLQAMDTTYHHRLLEMAEDGALYPPAVTDDDCRVLDSDYARFSPDEADEHLLNSLKEINLDRNPFISIDLDEAFLRLQYPNGADELKDALTNVCRAAVYCVGMMQTNDTFILPRAGSWSNGRRVYGLIRVYSLHSGFVLMDQIPYLGHFLQDAAMEVAAGKGLPSQERPSVQGNGAVEKDADPLPLESKADVLQATVEYHEPDTLLCFRWPCDDVRIISLSIEGMADFGRTPYQFQRGINQAVYLADGGAKLSGIRLVGPYQVTLRWQDESRRERFLSGMIDAGTVYVHCDIRTIGSGRIRVQVEPALPVPRMNEFFRLRLKKANGVMVDYRLPARGEEWELYGGKASPADRLDVSLCDERWSSYFRF